jgi:LmbE family N-acetylglucosaminyl deacetylase
MRFMIMHENDRLRCPTLLLLIALSSTCACPRGGPRPQEATTKRQGVDALVFAPHPDDEALGTGGILRQIVERGGRAVVVVMTNGDGYPDAAAFVTGKDPTALQAADFLELARIRQGHSLDALGQIGLAEHALFLGYPDGGLAQVSAATQRPFVQPHTRKAETYGVRAPDYHLRAHGRAAPYTRASVSSDMVEIIKRHAPAAIYVTSEADGHGDHATAFRLVRDAALAAGYHGTLHTYVVHSGRGNDWPWPHALTLAGSFEAHMVDGVQIPEGVPWPPPRRVPLTPAQAAGKLAMIRAYDTEMKMQATLMESFAKSEEIFWPVQLP